MNKMSVMSLCPFLFTATCAPFVFLSGRVFSVLGLSTPQKLRRILNSFVFQFENGFLHVKPSQISLLAQKTTFIITSIYVVSCVQLQKGTFSYYVITQGPTFGSPLTSCPHLFNFGSTLPPPIRMFIPSLSSPPPLTKILRFDSFVAGCNQPLQIQQKIFLFTTCSSLYI